MANKDGVLSIGIEYKSELNKMITDLEGSLDTISRNNQLSKGMKQQFDNVIAEVRNFKATMEKELATLGSGKVDKTTFKSFKQSVANNFKSVREDIDRLDLAVSTLNSQMEIISNGVDLSKISKEFAVFEDYVNRTNEAVSQLIDTLGKQGISLFSFDNRNILDTKSKIKEIDDIISQLDNDKGSQFKLFDEKEAQAELDRLSVQLRSTLELMEHTEKQMSNMDNSTVGFKKMQGDFALLQLKAASLNDTIEMLYNVMESKDIIIEMDDKSFELYNKYTEVLSDNLDSIVTSAKNAKKELSALLVSQKQPTVKVSSDMNPNSSELTTTITIETTSSELWKKLSPILTDLQSILNSNPVVAPIKLVVAPNAVSSTENGDVGKVSSAYSKKYAKILAETGKDAVIDLEGAYKKTFTSIMDAGVSYAKETISKIQDIFNKSPINIKYDISQEEIDKIQNFVLSNKDGKKVNISGQITKAKQEVEELNINIEKTSSLLQEAQSKGNVKFDGFDKFTDDLSKSIGKLEELQNILKALQNIEITLAKASGLSSITEIENQWESLEKRIINATKLDGSFRKNASINKIASEYQKYIDMGGTNALSDISKIQENKDTIDAIISKAKEFQKQDFTNDSVEKLSVDLDGVIAKFDELISTVKTATNALYKIIRDGNVSDLDKQWSSISNKFKSIADESGKINLSKQKKEVQELMEMYQKYLNAGGMKPPFDLTDNTETLAKLNKVFSQINSNKLDISSISKEKGEFGTVKESVDSLTGSINTKTDAIKTEANTMELAARAEVKSIGKIIESVNQLIGKIKNISDIKVPKINISDTIQSDKSNISSDNTISQTVNQQEQLREAVLDTDTAYEKMTEAEKEARKSAIQTAVNSIPQAENTARYVHWGNIDQSKSILSNPNGMSTGDYGLISSFADCLGEAETSMEAIYKYWDSLHAEGFDKGSALVIDIPLDEVKDFERGLKDNIPQEYIKGFVDTENNAITLNTTLQNGLKETAEQAEKTTQSVQDISKTQIKDVFQGDDKTTTDASTTAIKEESKALEQVSNSAKEASESKKKFAKANKEVKASADSSKTSISEEEKYFNSLGKSLGQYQSTLTTISRKPADGNRSKDLQDRINTISSSLTELRMLESNTKKDGYIFNKKDVERGQQLEKIIKDNIEAVKQMSASQKGSTPLSRGKTIEWATDLMKQNTKWSKAAKIEVQGWIDKLATADPSNVEEIRNEILKVVRAEREAGREGRTWLDIFKDKKTYSFLGQAASMFSFYDLINLGRQGLNVIKDLDSALTEMRKVSDEATSSLKKFQSESFDVAKQSGTTALEIQNSAADFMRLGYSLKEASKLSEDANIYKNVGDMDISEATEHMISSIQAWQSEFTSATEASTNIIDRYNEIGNRFAITSADIGSAMERSAAALKAGGNTLNESIGLITAGNLIQQDADTTANALKVMSLRIRGSKADLEDMGESTDDLADSTSKLREQIKALTGIDIMIDENTFKSTAKIIQEIGAEWGKLTDVSKASTLELLAGKTRASTVAGLIENYQTIDKVIQVAEKSENSARIENEKYIQSIEGRINLLQSQVQEFWTKAIDSDTIKNGITLLTNFLELGTDIVDTFGLLPPILAGTGIIKFVKNFA